MRRLVNCKIAKKLHEISIKQNAANDKKRRRLAACEVLISDGIIILFIALFCQKSLSGYTPSAISFDSIAITSGLSAA